MRLPTDIAISTCRLATTQVCDAIEVTIALAKLQPPRASSNHGQQERLGLLLFKISTASQACLKPSRDRRGINEVGAYCPGFAFGVTWETTITLRASPSLIPALESPCLPKNPGQLSAVWYGGHGDSNARISYMRGPNGETEPAISIIMVDKYGEIDIDRGDDIVYCGTNSLDNTSKNTPADGEPPVRGNAALFKPPEKKTRLVRICSKNPERQHERPGLRHSDDLQNGNDQVGDDYLEDPLADLGDPGLFASTGPEENIDFHTSLEGMLLISQGLGPMALPEIGQADNFSNDSGFQGGITNAASPLSHGPATGDAAMEVFYTIKCSSSSSTETLLAVTLLDKTWRT
ncbi:YDG/SRA domain-containing protein [Colletotrichum fioriniae PJ7]|uniref:YDG/SRA domain-containing protein n=1 Tax=Colletotrichum fioriniae PJ7 TaxID=1445577 RepID=A0A010QFL4_9PEZI|nr:YDG/SRA domain-containing protein [Colletotrichum fioriniae PJ7]